MGKVVMKNVSKSFGSTTAVKDVNLEIEDKEFVTLVGPSGCGKTTTLRLLAGLEDPDKGEIFIGDESVNDVPPKDRDVAMVFQSYALYPHMDARDNIAFGLKTRDLPDEEIERRVREAAETLQIDELLDANPSELSGGQQQRVALGRAIAREPKVFLMDEPLSNLDAKLRVQMRVELRKLQQKLETTTIYVTHDQEEAMTMSERLAIMKDGELHQVGTPQEVYDKPKNLFVGGFIGSPAMNMIDSSLKRMDDGFVCDAGCFELEIPTELGQSIADGATGSEVVLGLRPENISLSETQGHIEAEVFAIEPMGSHKVVTLRIGENSIKVKAPKQFESSAGERVGVEFNMNDMHIFDKRTESTVV